METNISGCSSPVPLLRRKRITPEQRQPILTRFHEGELTQQAFAAREGMSATTLRNWLREEQESKVALLPSISFQEVKLPSGGASWAIEIVTPHNWTLRLAQCPPAGALQQLLSALPC